MGADPESSVQSWAGGTCGNVIAILAYLGWKAFPIARMNGDPASARVRADLRRWGVQLDFTGCTPTSHTPIIIQQIRRARDGSPSHRFLWSCPRCGQRLPSFKAVTQDAVETVAPRLSGTAVFFMDRLSRAALTLAARASAEGAIVVFEPSGKSDEKLFAEAIQLAHVVKYADQRLAAAGGTMQGGSAALIEVQTLGAKGLRYRHRLGKGISAWFHLNAIAAPHLLDTCGAGDWCTAGLVTKVAIEGQIGLRKVGAEAIRHALRYGQALAAWNCGFEGARGGMYAVKRETFNYQIEALLSGRPNFSPVETKTVAGPSFACPACPPDEPHAGGVKPDRARRFTTKAAAA
ncbi:MAG: PfkB family carbohydrate kinase [Methylovirgula sp.]